MGFWSINPYVGCAFGCAYCYARDTHRYTIERAGAVGERVTASMPPWLAFERRVLVKEHAGARVREALRSSRAPRREIRWLSARPPTRISQPNGGSA